jgi:hypothetical protein
MDASRELAASEARALKGELHVALCQLAEVRMALSDSERRRTAMEAELQSRSTKLDDCKQQLETKDGQVRRAVHVTQRSKSISRLDMDQSRDRCPAAPRSCAHDHVLPHCAIRHTITCLHTAPSDNQTHEHVLPHCTIRHTITCLHTAPSDNQTHEHVLPHCAITHTHVLPHCAIRHKHVLPRCAIRHTIRHTALTHASTCTVCPVCAAVVVAVFDVLAVSAS